MHVVIFFVQLLVFPATMQTCGQHIERYCSADFHEKEDKKVPALMSTIYLFYFQEFIFLLCGLTFVSCQNRNKKRGFAGCIRKISERCKCRTFITKARYSCSYLWFVGIFPTFFPQRIWFSGIQKSSYWINLCYWCSLGVLKILFLFHSYCRLWLGYLRTRLLHWCKYIEITKTFN